MTDSSLDREIESLVAADPSPEFLACVRARVADEPEPGAWKWSSVFAFATATVAVMGSVMMWQWREPHRSNQVSVTEPQVAGTVTAPALLPEPEVVPYRKPQPRVVGVVARTGRIDLDLPEVVVAENEARAFAWLVARNQQGRFDVLIPTVPDPDGPVVVDGMADMPPIAVDPIEIEPIVASAARQLEGERP